MKLNRLWLALLVLQPGRDPGYECDPGPRNGS